jgi:hypothetical protein
MNKWARIPYEMGKKAVGAVRKMGSKGAVKTAMNVSTGVAVGSMIPMSASTQTDKDIARMRQYQPDKKRQNTDGRRQQSGDSHA